MRVKVLQLMKLRYLLVPALLLAFLFTGTSCAYLTPTGPTLIVPTPVASSLASSQQPASGPTLALPDVISVVSKVRPAVVMITTKTTVQSFFGRQFTQEGAGSGWIIAQDGFIVTNNHVVEGADSVTVTLDDGRHFSADMVRTAPSEDLAIIKINAQDLPTLKVGDSSDLQVGEWVVALGNSLGMGVSATKGIVSVLDVSLSVSEGEALSGLIQTDAAINPGNSGGPLVNLAGEVVGINSAKVAQVGVEGMGYAISSKEATPIIDQLIQAS
jgi:serine protease Do